jgi:hypothetical protein
MTAVCREKWWALLLERWHIPKPCALREKVHGKEGLFGVICFSEPGADCCDILCLQGGWLGRKSASVIGVEMA